MSCEHRRHGCVTARNAVRASCVEFWDEEPVDLIEAIEDAITRTEQLGTLDDDRTRDAALTLALAVAHRLLHDPERLDAATDRIVEVSP